MISDHQKYNYFRWWGGYIIQKQTSVKKIALHLAAVKHNILPIIVIIMITGTDAMGSLRNCFPGELLLKCKRRLSNVGRTTHLNIKSHSCLELGARVYYNTPMYYNIIIIYGRHRGRSIIYFLYPGPGAVPIL